MGMVIVFFILLCYTHVFFSKFSTTECSSFPCFAAFRGLFPRFVVSNRATSYAQEHKSGGWCIICDKIEDKLLVTYRVPFHKERKEGAILLHYCIDRSVFRNLSMRTCIFQADRCIGWQWHNLLFFFPYLLCAISIDIVPVHPLPAFCPRRLHSLRQRRSQCLACQSLVLCKNTDQHPPLPRPTHSSHSSSLLYPTIPSTTSSHNKQNKKEIVHITAQSRLHVFAKRNALAQAFSLLPSISDE